MPTRARDRTIDIADEAAMMNFGSRLAGLAVPGDLITLHGNLGAGKTVLARGFVRGASMSADIDVPSPTFTLVQLYDTANFTIWHFDLYRLEAAADIWELGFEEALDEGVSLVEWPERADHLLPDDRLDLVLDDRGTSDTRKVTLKPGPSWEERLADV